MNFKVFYFQNSNPDADSNQTYHFVNTGNENRLKPVEQTPPIQALSNGSLKVNDPYENCFNKLVQMKVESYAIKQLLN
jgi:hypothetical protein